MKKTHLLVSLLLIVVLLVSSCGGVKDDIWQSATYKTDTTVGEGENTAIIEIKNDEKSVTITLKTNEDYLGAALFAEGLINDPSFFDTLNGMQLVWSECHAYWALYINGSYATVGVDEVLISATDKYTFIYTRG